MREVSDLLNQFIQEFFNEKHFVVIFCIGTILCYVDKYLWNTVIEIMLHVRVYILIYVFLSLYSKSIRFNFQLWLVTLINIETYVLAI